MKSFYEWLNESTNLPPEPGSVSVSSGHVRLYHQTNADKVASIRANGIQKSYSRGQMLKEPVVIWATETPFYGDAYQQGIATVEFSMPACSPTSPVPCFMKPTYVMGDVVPPESIIAIHEYWHSIAKFLMQDYPECDEKTLELMNDFKTIDEDHKKAVEVYLKYKCKRWRI